MKAQLQIQLIKQGKRYVAYSPALDLSTTGRTAAEAKKRFNEITELFLAEINEAGTLADVLTELGWKQTKVRSTRANWRPPVVKNGQMQVRIPALA